MEKLLFITGNAGKAKEYRQIFGESFQIEAFDLVEIQELDVEKIIASKVKEAYKVFKRPLIVEDVSLIFNAINPLPGPLIKWFLKSIGHEGLIKILGNYPDKSAQAIATIGFYNGEKLTTFEGIVNGKIKEKKDGIQGFGWDAIFLPDGSEKTYAQMSTEEKSSISHRRKVIAKLQTFLQSATATKKLVETC